MLARMDTGRRSARNADVTALPRMPTESGSGGVVYEGVMQVPRHRFAPFLLALAALLGLALSRPWAEFGDGTAAPVAALSATAEGSKILPPAAGIYHAAFPDFGGSEDRVTAARISAFTTLVERPIAWSYFSNNWMDGLVFPAANAAAAHSAGTVPFIRMMPRSNWNEGGPDPVYTMAAIAAGTFDPQLTQWARDARGVGYPLMVEFGTEVNGDWFSWNGRYNGGTVAGPANFRSAYRHIVDIFRQQGVTNVTWVFHVDAQPSPEATWNSMSAYYPGDDYVDWLGISAYGPQSPTEDWQEFTQVMDSGYAELAALSPSKPIALLEFSVTDGYPGHSKASWISNAFSAIRSGRYPRLKGISWWHENFSNGDGTQSLLRVDSSPAALDAYRKAVADPFFTTAVATSAPATPPQQPTAVPTTTRATPVPTQTPTPAGGTRVIQTAPTPSPTTPPPASPPKAPATGFADGFESFAAGSPWANGGAYGGWVARTNGDGTTAIERDGTKTLSLAPLAPASPAESRAALVESAVQFNDADFTVRVKTVTQLRARPNPWEAGWIVWSRADDQHFYYVILKSNGIEVGKQDPAYPGGRRYLVTSADKTYKTGRWYTVRVRQSVGTINVWVDGTLRASFTDNERPYSTGSIALLADDAHVRFDNVSVK